MDNITVKKNTSYMKIFLFLAVIVFIGGSMFFCGYKLSSDKYIQANKTEVDLILQDMSLSTDERVKKIKALTDSVKANCETLKKDIINSMKACEKPDIENYFSAQEYIENFKRHYAESTKVIENKVEYSKDICVFIYGSGSYGSVYLATVEYEAYKQLDDELQGIKEKFVF